MIFRWSLMIECPKCCEDIDFKMSLGKISKGFCLNELDKFIKFPVLCPFCDNVFEIDRVEY